MARGKDGASSNSLRSLFQRRLSEANNFQKALITSLLAWVALGGVELSDRRADPFGCGVPLARGDGLAGVADLAKTRGLN